MFVLALMLAVLIGLSLGLLGSGGSIITLPVLVYVARVPPHQAVGMSLVIVGSTSALGTLVNLRRGHFDWPSGLFFAFSGIAGAFLGAKFTHLVSGRILLICFGALMLFIGARMLSGSPKTVPQRQCKPVHCFGVGLAVGALTGFLGVGGGFVILPALVLFAGLEMKTAVGTSLAVIAVNSFSGLVGQLGFIDFNWGLTFQFVGAAAAGMLAGLALANWFSGQALRRAFAGAIIVLGLLLLVNNLARMNVL